MKKKICIVFMLTTCIPALAACGLSASGVVFGTYQSPIQSGDVLSSGSVMVTCEQSSVGLAYKLKLASLQSGSAANKVLSNGQDALAYNIYLDSGRSVIWGDGTSGTGTYNATTNLKDDVSLFGVIYRGQNVSPGSYADTVTIQMEF